MQDTDQFACLLGIRSPWRVSLVDLDEAELTVTIHQLGDSALKTASAWALKEHAMCLWQYTSRTWATRVWTAWGVLSDHSALEPMRKVACTIGEQLWSIVKANLLKRSNAVAESVNSRIQRLQRCGGGFGSRDRFRTVILVHPGKLDLYPQLDPAISPT